MGGPALSCMKAAVLCTTQVLAQCSVERARRDDQNVSAPHTTASVNEEAAFPLT